MVHYCVAYGCNETFKKGSGISFHSFPADETRKKQWIISLRRENFVPGKHSRLCSKHFSPECFDNEAFGVGVKLKPNSVPTIFDFPPHLLKVEKKRKPAVKRKLQVDSGASTSCVALQEEENESPPKAKVFRKSYVGDYTEETVKSPRKAQAFMQVAKEVLQKSHKKLKLERQKYRRAIKQLQNGKALINHLKEKMMITEDAACTLEKCLSPAAAQLLLRTKDGDTRAEYPPELRCFALTLNFYSSRAYSYLREVFPHGLPHPSTLRKWYQSVDGKPGFSSEAANALISKGKEMALNGKPLVCALMMDEMCIRKHIEFDGKRFVGYVNCGTEIEDQDLPEAKEALVFMVVSLNGHWKIPVGYFLINGLSGSERANLVIESLKFLYDLNVTVVSLTFDGAASNLSMARCLGASFDENNMVNWFENPSNGAKVFILLDACHTIKLVRNTLGAKRTFARGDYVIDWRYLEELEKLQSSEGLHLGTKLTKRHIHWEKEPMKVKLATQTFSESVASALTYCDKDLNLPQFQGCEETVKFVRLMNNIFDILNSRNLCSKGWQKPLKAENINSTRAYIQEAIEYIQSLQEMGGGVRLVKCSRKTGFIGLIVCLKSVLGVYDSILNMPQLKMHFLLTYKLSQDHLEVFFSAIRSHGGHNNNPTARQFEAAYKRLLLHIQIGTTTSANCSAVDPTVIVNCRDRTQITCDPVNLPANSAGVLFVNHDHDYIPHPANLTLYVEDVVEYIAGFVVKRLQNVVKCDVCKAVLQTAVSHSALLNRKNRGGLSIPSLDVVYLCREGEKMMRQFQLKMTRMKDPLNVLVMAVLNHAKREVFDELQEHTLHSPPLDNHIHQLKRAVLMEYFKVRFHHKARLETEKLHSVRVRSFHTKTVLFKNQ